MCPWRGQDWCPLTSDLWAMFLVYSVLPVSGSDLVLADLPLSGPSGAPRCLRFPLSSHGCRARRLQPMSRVQRTAPGVVPSLGAGSPALTLIAGSRARGS